MSHEPDPVNGQPSLRLVGRSNVDPVARRRSRPAGNITIATRPSEAILPLDDAASEEFALRLATWLADVSMNGQRTA
jgi:hypothetical protein